MLATAHRMRPHRVLAAEEFLLDCLQCELSVRESPGGEGRLCAHLFPAADLASASIVSLHDRLNTVVGFHRRLFEHLAPG